MSPRQLNGIGTIGVVLSLILSGWYLLKTYQEGNPRWYFLIMVCGIAMMLAYGVTENRNNRRNRRNRRR